MNFNVGDLMFSIIKTLVDLPSKLYTVLTYEVDISWITKIFSFFNAEVGLPENISLWSMFATIGAVALVGIIIYNIFKL